MKLNLCLALSLVTALTACSSSKDDKVRNDDPNFCAIADNGEMSPGIINGRKVNSESWIGRSTVFLLNKEDDSISMCTGSLIDRNIILTAAHCVPRFAVASQLKVLFGANPICGVQQQGASAMREVDQIRIHPGYRFGDEDIAMVRLSDVAPSGTTLARLVTEEIPMTADTNIIVAGYGRTTDIGQEDSQIPFLHYTNLRPYSGVNAQKSRRPLSSQMLYFDQRGGSGACRGDSGGPAFARDSSGTYRVIGVAKAVDPLDGQDFTERTVSCRIGIRYTSVTYYKTWIENTFTELRNYNSQRSRAFDR